MTTTHNLGFPRIGAKRELKFGLESYWKGEMSRDALEEFGARLRRQHREVQANLDLVPVGDFAYYDQIAHTGERDQSDRSIMISRSEATLTVLAFCGPAPRCGGEGTRAGDAGRGRGNRGSHLGQGGRMSEQTHAYALLRPQGDEAIKRFQTLFRRPLHEHGGGRVQP